MPFLREAGLRRRRPRRSFSCRPRPNPSAPHKEEPHAPIASCHGLPRRRLRDRPCPRHRRGAGRSTAAGGQRRRREAAEGLPAGQLHRADPGGAYRQSRAAGDRVSGEAPVPPGGGGEEGAAALRDRAGAVPGGVRPGEGECRRRAGDARQRGADAGARGAAAAHAGRTAIDLRRRQGGGGKCGGEAAGRRGGARDRGDQPRLYPDPRAARRADRRERGEYRQCRRAEYGNARHRGEPEPDEHRLLDADARCDPAAPAAGDAGRARRRGAAGEAAGRADGPAGGHARLHQQPDQPGHRQPRDAGNDSEPGDQGARQCAHQRPRADQRRVRHRDRAQPHAGGQDRAAARRGAGRPGGRLCADRRQGRQGGARRRQARLDHAGDRDDRERAGHRDEGDRRWRGEGASRGEGEREGDCLAGRTGRRP